MHIFLDSHPQSPYGIRFWAGRSETEERIHSYPLYKDRSAAFFYGTYTLLEMYGRKARPGGGGRAYCQLTK